jgi:hypothetical protein
MVGRNVLFPGDDDPLAITAAVSSVIHENATADQAAELIPEHRGTQLDAIRKYF